MAIEVVFEKRINNTAVYREVDVEQRRQINVEQVGLQWLLVQPRGVEHMVNQRVKPLHVVEHEAIKVGLLLLAHRAAGQGLQVQLERGDRRLQLVAHTIDEAEVIA